MTGAADIIEEMENPPMPPVIQEDVVIGATLLLIWQGWQTTRRDQLIRASMGIAMLHPDRFDVLISTKHKALLPRMNEKDICAAKLNSDPPHWRPNRLACIGGATGLDKYGNWRPCSGNTLSRTLLYNCGCEKNLVLMQPIDEVGKEHIGKVIIVDPIMTTLAVPSQVAEALKKAVCAVCNQRERRLCSGC